VDVFPHICASLTTDMEQTIGDWVQHYNHERYHESLDNVTPS